MFERSIRFRDRSISWIRFRNRSITSIASRNRQFPTFQSISFEIPYCFDSIWSKITENAWFQKWSIDSKWSIFDISFNSLDILRLFWEKMVKNACFQKRARLKIISSLSLSLSRRNQLWHSRFRNLSHVHVQESQTQNHLRWKNFNQRDQKQSHQKTIKI